MTKEQIQALIDAKIAGQGSAIDIGGALPAILGGILELATQSGGPVSWEFNLIRNESYTTWESVNMTQEIYDAIINGTIDLINIKWYFEGTVGIPMRALPHNDAGEIDVRSSFTVSFCSKVLALDVKPDGTVHITWD